ncbi:MAG: ThuA domain-containing protein [Verrucomicrobiota bacterium]
MNESRDKTALIFSGGWEGHFPVETGRIFEEALSDHDFLVQHETSLEVLEDHALLASLDLICPNWTMGKLTETQSQNLRDAVHSGTGLGGFHGGMGDAFRGDTEYEWMVGGHFVGHPHVGEYTVQRTSIQHPITEGFPDEQPYNSEQYYLVTDPANEVLIDSTYVYEGKSCTMPVAWTKHWGAGRVFYSSLGHQPSEFTDFPAVKEMTVRGLLWASGAIE